MDVLVIGGSRFMGRRLTFRLLAAGHRVTLLNRGLAADPFRQAVRRLRADRHGPSFADALKGLRFDAAVDFQAFSAADARSAVDALRGRLGHYVAVSSGQVYLVRQGGDSTPPWTEEDYPGPLTAEPEHPDDHGEWLYGVGKRAMEDVLREACAREAFPATVLRLPIVEGEGDPSRRLESYIWRLLDGGPLLLPDAGTLVRHVYAGDVARSIGDILGAPRTFGEAYNLCQDEMPTLQEFIELLGDILGASGPVIPTTRARLVAHGLDPRAVSPFSTPWMSLLDPAKAQRDLGFRHEPLREYLGHIAGSILAHAPTEPPRGYALRAEELAVAGRPEDCI